MLGVSSSLTRWSQFCLLPKFFFLNRGFRDPHNLERLQNLWIINSVGTEDDEAGAKLASTEEFAAKLGHRFEVSECIQLPAVDVGPVGLFSWVAE